MFLLASILLGLFVQQTSARGVIAGRITDANREAVAGAYVQLLVISYDNIGHSRMMRASGVLPVRTDQRGEYRFNGVGTGNYYVRSEVKSVVTYYPGVSELDSAVPVELRSGVELSAMDFSLARSSPFKLSGRIVDPFRQGRAAYEYYLVRRNVRVRDIDESIEDQDSNDDRFEFRNVQPGAYDLYVGYIGDSFGSNWGYSGHVSIEVVDRDVTDLTVNIASGSDITCEIRLDESAAVLKPDMLYAPLWVHFRGADDMPSVRAPSLSQSSLGRRSEKFQLAHAAPGRYRFEMEIPSSTGLFVSAARFGARDIVGQVFEVSENETGPLVVELSGSGATIEGIVTDNSGNPIARSIVWIVPALNFREDPTAYHGTVGDSQGRFKATAIRPGSYTVFAFALSPIPAGGIMNADFLAPYLNYGVPVDLPKGEVIRRDLKAISLQR